MPELKENISVYVNDSLIVFGKKEYLVSNDRSLSDFIVSKQEDITQIVKSIKSFQLHDNYFFETETPNLLFKSFSKEFKILQAAGGLVLNDKYEILMIHRFEHWDFPKGKVEKGETVNEAALREVIEETAVANLSITKQLPAAYHIYIYSDVWILKETFWYLMHSDYTGTLIPQFEEDILAAIWVPLDFLGEYMSQSYLGLQNLVKYCKLIR
ncbi:MAG: NUDIX domain-containing protein [Bacteroidales bacterium]|nr:NUDIX domain-containing protein [Bacteroidales bacterium]